MPAVGAPTASAIGETGATLAGSVTSNGLPTQWWFEYGTDQAFRVFDNTARRSVGGAAVGEPVADTLTGLASATVYYFRICASNSLGTTRSATDQFMTSSARACMSCHGGNDGTQPGVNGAPVITRYWQTSGHGGGTRGPALRCEDCHDIAAPGTHSADGSGTLNTLSWPGKADDTTNANTAHLRSFFFPASPASATAADYAVAFDNACNNRVGCHTRADGSRIFKFHQHGKTDNAMEFGLSSTPANPKVYTWYAQADYAADFYKSRSVWVVQDLTTSAPGPPHYGTCISCHDPHGTGTTNLNRDDGTGTNVMVRGEWKAGFGSLFCAGVCHVP